ncbi:MAG: T9SS type A sorting domain-containing protein [bacterium]|nr:T9SS type A sorting domain-containing protein [bacterium]
MKIATIYKEVDPLVGFAEDVKIINGVAFIADAEHGLSVYNVKDLKQPFFLDGIALSASGYHTCVTGTVLFDDNENVLNPPKPFTRIFVGSGADGLYEIDATDPSNLVYKYCYGNPHEPITCSFIRDLFIYESGSLEEDNYIYLATDTGLIYYCCPTALGRTNSTTLTDRKFVAINKLNGVYADQNYVYTVSVAGYFRIIDARDKGNPRIVSSLEIISSVALWDVYVKDNKAYLVDQGGHFYIVEVQNKSKPRLLNTYTLFETEQKAGYEGRIVVIGNYAILSSQLPTDKKSLRVLDISSPNEIEEVGYYQKSDDFGIIGIDVIDNIVYAGAVKQGFKIYEFNPDGYKFDMTCTEKVKYEVEDQIDVYVSRYYSGVPFTYANVYLEDYYGNRICDPKTPDAFGNVSFNITKTDTLPTRVVAVNTSETVQTEKRNVYADYKEFANLTVNKDEIPTFRYEGELVTAKEYLTYPPDDETKTDLIPSVGSEITTTFTDNSGNLISGITDSEGQLNISGILQKSTRDVMVTVDKVGFLAKTVFVKPYMWSTTNEATGKNNGNHIFRDNLTKSVYITYTDGDKVIYGEKDSLSSGFDLIVAGEGDGSVLGYNSRRNIKILLWKNNADYLSAWFNSPIEETDTLQFPALSVNEPSLMFNSLNGYMSGSGIVYRYLGDEAGDLIYDSFFIYPEDPTVLIPYTGEQDIYGDLIKVKNNQSNSFYNQYVNGTTVLSPIITYISTNNECAIKRLYVNNAGVRNWLSSQILSEINNTASNSTIWRDGDTTRVVWENTDSYGNQSILQRKIIGDYVSENVELIEDNAYDVKARDHRIYTYVKDNSVCLKQFVNAVNIERTIAEGEDSVFAPDFDITYSPRVAKTRIYSIWTEKKDDEYRINYFEDSIGALAVSPLYASELASMEITMTESSIYDYVIGKFPVEKMKYDIAGLQQDHYYEVSVITSDKNPYIPQIVKIDGEVIGVVYGGKGEDTTNVMVPKEYYEDGYLSIELERKVGKDTRVARVECYEYDEVDLETLTQLGKGNRIKLNEEQTDAKINNIVENGLIAYEVTETGAGEIEVIDITGRVVKESKVKSIKGINTFSVKELPAGIYFIRTDDTTNKLRKIIKLK